MRRVMLRHLTSRRCQVVRVPSSPSVHPFPARMAPELIERQLSRLSPGRTLLDPMMGSGTFVLDAASRGHFAIGVDTDPLARIITAAASGEYNHERVLSAA